MANQAAYGTALNIGSASGVGGTAIAQIRNISGPGLSMDTIDMTAHDSTGGWRVFVAGLLDGGEISFELAFDPVAATHRDASGGLLNLMTTRASDEFTVTFTDTGASIWYFNAFVTGFEPSMDVDGGLMASVTMKITGAPTLV